MSTLKKIEAAFDRLSRCSSEMCSIDTIFYVLSVCTINGSKRTSPQVKVFNEPTP